MKLHAVMVTKNEAQRYLYPVLERLKDQVDTIFVYDDRSDDTTVEIVKQFTDLYEIRPECLDSFSDDESHFRRNSYEMFEGVVGPEPGDYVLSIDADEMLVEDYPGQLKDYLSLSSHSAHSFHVAEVFGVLDGVPMIRTDGFWAQIESPRAFRWLQGETYVMKDKIMGCGSVPEWAMQAVPVSGPSILHYGYADRNDQVTKYARYFGVRGHSTAHVQSILRKPTLIPWDGPTLEGVG